jgi:predicted lipopolysaccharide heptosyltransferase III
LKILLIRLREIGDVVFTTPAVHALRRQYPHAELEYLVEPAAAPILTDNPHLSKLMVVPRVGGWRQPVADLILARRLRAARYDLAIDFHGGPRAAWLSWASGAPQRIGYDIPGRAWMYTTRVERPRGLRPRHSVRNQWDLLGPLGIAAPDPSAFPLEMAEAADARDAVARRLSQAQVRPEHVLIVMHVSAGNPFRRWPVDAFIELIVRLAGVNRRRRIVVTAGPSDEDVVARMLDEAARRLPDDHRAAIVRCGEFSLAELRSLVARAALYIGGDSGPLHVAATTRTPIVALFGPTLPERSAPWRDPALVTECVDVGALPCRPCEQRQCAPGDFRCLTRLSAERVAAAAERALARRDAIDGQFADNAGSVQP